MPSLQGDRPCRVITIAGGTSPAVVVPFEVGVLFVKALELGEASRAAGGPAAAGRVHARRATRELPSLARRGGVFCYCGGDRLDQVIRARGANAAQQSPGTERRIEPEAGGELGAWRQLGVAIEAHVTLDAQPRGRQLEYDICSVVIALNHAGRCPQATPSPSCCEPGGKAACAQFRHFADVVTLEEVTA